MGGEKRAGQVAGALYDEGLFCAESVLLALATRQGIETDLFPGIASGFCAGLSRTCGPCGAVSGAVMGIGLALGRCDGTEPPAAAYGATQALLARFTAEFGSTNCAELLDGCDLGTAEGQARFRTEGLRQRCRVFTTRAADLAAAIVDEMG